ncbi:glutamate N-acetyltransferase [Desulfocicer vacuolatum DSM 3385]|uniref:Arginine biosynthesis bifunctional protein ArgJ n=1 Tax=Desulfocicer vacuolatum DSM 3385 TaxID=1121400 RepID=A0A1W1ZMM5_9BACT|nr:bifunctional glutamate N-acetyltransferase/amino-acid acetyltransferase ArgJ [Desulfocicer vacuolatum]SMC49503.1 glutamate N-acetyltransferase [Desulfocicer vacuolatum DSM 3385]
MKGFQFNGIAAGIKTNGNKDLGIIYSQRPASAAALFTTNKVVAAPVILGRERIVPGICQAVVVNSGNANCFTGEQGYKDAVETACVAAEALNIPEDLVLVSSTGVIGAPLPMEKIHTGIPLVVGDMAWDKADDFAQAILTTDLAKKIVSKTCTVKGKTFSVCGFAKGSGMIRPNMATMLAFVCTDLDISSTLLKTALQKACDTSFNRISVDGDTSTNDMVIAMANGMSGAVLEDSDDALEFQQVMDEILLELSKMIVRDGEGATKIARITVRGAASAHDAFLAAEAIAHSNLVKTALYGEDPNWGRITAAAGRSGAMVDPDKMDLYFGEVALVMKGEWQGVDAEKEAAREMKADELEIILDLNLGDHSDFFMFCDFSENYVKINADYRS